MRKEYSYTESIKICEKALDMLNIKSFLIIEEELHNIMRAIEDYIDDGDGEDIQKVEEFMEQYPEIFHNPPELFNYMTEDEFLGYCQKRFPEIYWGHEVVENYWISGIK